MTTETRKQASHDGVTLRYVDTGTGEPALVFIHGWGCDLTHWRDQIPHFAKNHRVIALDQRGHGQSDKPDQDYTVAGFVEDLEWLIAELGLKRPIVIGHSMGGTIAMNFARRHPDLTRAVILVDSPLAIPEAARPMAEQVFAGLKTPAYEGIAAGFVRMQMFNNESPPALVEEIIAGMTATPQRVLHSALEDTLATANVLPGPIPVPALFIRASTQLADDATLKDKFPGMEVTTVAGAHFVQMENPKAVDAAIEEFVRRVS